MSLNAEWTNADALAFRPYTAYASAPVTYSATTDPMSDLQHENAKLRELCADLYAEMLTYSAAPNYNASVWAVKLRELGVEVE